MISEGWVLKHSDVTGDYIEREFNEVTDINTSAEIELGLTTAALRFVSAEEVNQNGRNSYEVSVNRMLINIYIVQAHEFFHHHPQKHHHDEKESPFHFYCSVSKDHYFSVIDS